MTSNQKQVISKRIAGCVLGLRFFVGSGAQSRTETTKFRVSSAYRYTTPHYRSRYIYIPALPTELSFLPMRITSWTRTSDTGITNPVIKLLYVSFQFSHYLLRRAKGDGAIDEIQTRDPWSGNPILYQLSYYRI